MLRLKQSVIRRVGRHAWKERPAEGTCLVYVKIGKWLLTPGNLLDDKVDESGLLFRNRLTVK